MSLNVECLKSSSWEEVDCILCGIQTETAVVWPDTMRGNIVRCRRCNLVFRNPRQTEDRQVTHFTEEWTEARPAFFLEDYRTKNLQRIAGWILKHYPRPGRIMDIGCSYGKLLAQFPASWEKWGLEPSQTAARVARQRLPAAHILEATLWSAKLPGRSFDVITMVDTIYYLHNPLRDLSRLIQMLKPGGCAIIESQNFANRGTVYRWLKHPFDDTWMYFYTPKSLSRTLTKVGLRIAGKMYLPGHRVGSAKFSDRLITYMEFGTLNALRHLTLGLVDLVPHFVLLAKPV